MRTDLVADRDRVRADPKLLAAPLLIVVPSRSLRLHLARKVVEWTGGACAGVEVLTLAGAARQVLVAGGERPPRGALLFESLVTTALRGDSLLSNELGSFEDAERSLAATLRDLFDAGFASELGDALIEALRDPSASASGTRAELERAEAILRIAAAIETRAVELDLDVGAGGFRRAAKLIGSRTDVFACRGVWIVGFSDATGSALDLLEILLRREGSRVYADALADGSFGALLRSRLAIPASRAEPVSPAATLTLSRAPSVDAEVRAAANRVLSSLERGIAPERIAIVARDLAPYRVALRRHLGRLAIPFSVIGATGSLGPADRRVRAVAELFEAQGACELGRWLAARDTSRASTLGREAVVSAGLRALGVRELHALAGLDLAGRLAGQDSLRLRLRGAASLIEEVEKESDDFESESDGEPEDAGGEFTAPNTVSKLVPLVVTRAEFDSELEPARRALARFEDWKTGATVLEHAEAVRAFVADVLAWNELTPGRAPLESALQEIAFDAPPDLQLPRSDFFALLSRALGRAAVTPLGPEGGGVTVLDVTEARGRTFEIVHVLGLARGRFPRVVREDPLLSDAVRGRLAAVLPDLAKKGTGRDEERVLFEALVRSAPAVHLSWPTLDDDGKSLLPSALLEHVALPAEITTAPIECEPLAEGSLAWELPRPAHEHIVVASLKDRRQAFDELAPLVIEEVRSLSGLGAAPSAQIARARSSILAEFEPAFLDRARLGPYFGFVGRANKKADPRTKGLYVSHLEAVAGCGWQAFLKYVLRLEPPFDPSSDLPDVEPRLVGDVVHAVLKRVVDERVARVSWPADAALGRLLLAEARSALRERGILLPGFEALILARVRPLIEVARALDRREGPAPVSTSEIGGAIAIPEGLLAERELSFRADRLDELADGKRYTDFKTGKPKSKAGTPDAQRKSLVNEIAGGRKLQAIVYARHAGAGGVGRYVYLDETLPDELRVFQVSNDDSEANDTLDESLEVLLGAWDVGAFTPRMLGANLARDGELCARCEHKIACLRGDSTAHRRLQEFVGHEADGPGIENQTVRKLWNIGRVEKKPAAKSDAPATSDAPKKRGKKTS